MLVFGACSLSERAHDEHLHKTNNGLNSNFQGSRSIKDQPEVKALGDVNPTMRSISEAKFDNVRLEFFDENGTSILITEIPDEAVEEINKLFRTRLSICSQQRAEANRNAKVITAVKYDTKIVRESEKTQNKLTNVKIETPTGPRTMSSFEAGKLIRLVSLSSPQWCD